MGSFSRQNRSFRDAFDSRLQGLVGGRKYYALRAVLFVLACALIAVAMFMFTSASSQLGRTQQLATNMVQSDQRAQVLVLASYDDADSATQMQRDGIIDLLERSSIACDVEYLDVRSGNVSANILDGSDYVTYGATLAKSDWGRALTKKISERGNYSAIICIDDDALCYCEAVHDDYFTEMPVVFVGVNDAAHAKQAFESGQATGVVEVLDAKGVLETAKQMRPDATQVLVVTDNTASGRGSRAQFQTQFLQLEEENDGGLLLVEYLNSSKVTRAELAESVSRATDDTVVIYLDAHSDVAGKSYSATQSAYFVSQASSQPVFAVGFGGVGEGFVASSILDYERAGQRAAELVVMILNGTSPADIPLESFSSIGMAFDSQLLSDARIVSSAVPAGATMINQSGLSLDSLRAIFLPITLLVLGVACIIAFAVLGYRRTANDLAEVLTQRNTLERRFYTDHLTQIPNMQWLTAYAASDASKRVRSIIEVVLSDLGVIEKTRGVDTAERIIKELAERLNGLNELFLVRPDRHEFILGIDREMGPNSALLKELGSLLRQPVLIDGDSLSTEFCIGVFNRERGMSIEEMVAGVDIAVNQAEQVGMTDEVIFYDSDMCRAVEQRLEITTRLKEAIDNDDFFVVYQPQIELATNSVVGYEAFVRIRGEVYSPDQFIPIAEMNGQIVDIDRIVTKKVVQQLATWKKRKQRMRPISINYSAGQLRDEHFVEYAAALLDEYGVAHKYMRIDIKESLFVNNMQKASDFVDDLRRADFGIAIDGFGAGYTSISRLMQVPADVVKIDRTLTASFLAGRDDRVIANLVQLVHSADKFVVIEGVETADQLRMCRDMGCDMVQGFYFSKPLMPERAMQYKPPEFLDVYTARSAIERFDNDSSDQFIECASPQEAADTPDVTTAPDSSVSDDVSDVAADALDAGVSDGVAPADIPDSVSNAPVVPDTELNTLGEAPDASDMTSELSSPIQEED